MEVQSFVYYQAILLNRGDETSGWWVANTETELVTTVQARQGSEEMQVILGGSGLTRSGIHVFFSLLLGKTKRMRRSKPIKEPRIAGVDYLASWFYLRWVVGGVL